MMAVNTICLINHVSLFLIQGRSGPFIAFNILFAFVLHRHKILNRVGSGINLRLLLIRLEISTRHVLVFVRLISSQISP